MSKAETSICREDWEVGPRLLALKTDKQKLLRVRSVAVGAAADATPFHPANAAGTFSYQHGTFSLRFEHVGKEGWEAERPNGVEAIRNVAIKTRIVFANVDVACDDENEPKARSDKGAGAERLCAGNGLFGNLPRFVDPGNDQDWITYYLMIAPNGAAEMSQAVVENGKFSKYIERLYLSDGSDLDTDSKLLNDSDEVDIFDPQIARK